MIELKYLHNKQIGISRQLKLVIFYMLQLKRVAEMSHSPSISLVSHIRSLAPTVPTVLLNPGEVRREALPLVALGGEQVLPAEQHGPERGLQRRP